MAIARIYLLYMLVFGLIGPPIVLGFLPHDDQYFQLEYQLGLKEHPAYFPYTYTAYVYLIRDHDPALVWDAYVWLLYGCLILALLYALFLSATLRKYDARPLVTWSEHNYGACWAVAVVGTLACGWILSMQLGYQHPVATFYDLGWRDLNIKRAEIARTINLGIFSLGLNVFCAAATVIAIAFFRRWWVMLVTLAVIAWFVTLNFQKAPVGYLILEVLVIGLLLGIWSLRGVFTGLTVAALAFAGIFAFSLKSWDVGYVAETLIIRVFLGEFADLPSYFEVFRDNPAPLASLLPAYVKSWLAISADAPGRIIMQVTGPAENANLGGTANSFFVGEGYAVMGTFGAVISPFLVFANLFVVARVFSLLKKDFLNTFVFGFLTFKFLVGLFSGISIYLISSAQIVFLGYVGARLLAERYLPRIILIAHDLTIGLRERLGWPPLRE